MSRGPLWTQDEWDKAQRLAKDGWDAALIAVEMHRTEEAIRSRFNYMNIKIPRRGKAPSRGADHTPSVSETAMAERDARYAAATLRTQTQEFFGDPAPGYSALDRKRQEARS